MSNEVNELFDYSAALTAEQKIEKIQDILLCRDDPESALAMVAIIVSS